MASKCPLKVLLPLVILKDSSMTLEVETREKEVVTLSHSLQQTTQLSVSKVIVKHGKIKKKTACCISCSC